MDKDPHLFWAYVDQSGGPDACWPWLRGHIPDGYGSVVWGDKTKGAHVVAFELENGPLQKGQCVCHSCDNPPCCNPAHLFAGTKGDNNADTKAKDRHTRGERHPLAKLTDEDVMTIRSVYRKRDREFGGAALARKYGVAECTLNRVVLGRSWHHV